MGRNIVNMLVSSGGRYYMKRSKANEIIQYTIDKLKEAQFPLPPFAYYGLEEWKNLGEDAGSFQRTRIPLLLDCFEC